MSRDFEASSNDYIEVGDVPALDLTGDEVSLSAWIRLESINGEQKVLAKWADVGDRFQYLLSVNTSNHVIFAVYSGGVALTEGTTVLAAGAWHHIAGVYDGSTIRVYLDGVEEGSASKSGNMPSTTAPVRIGAGSSGAGTEQPFDGEIGHCGIWDAPLTAGEVASLAAGISPLKIRKDDNLQLYAPLNGQDPEYDVIGGLDLAVNGPAKSEEPPIPNSIVAP